VTEFVETAMRHFCRNPKCRAKLKTPTSNSWEAFCSLKPNGCRDRYYRLRCYVCDEKKTGNLQAHTCGRRKCKSTLRTLGPPTDTNRVGADAKSAHLTGLREPVSDSRGWHIVAGRLIPNASHCATVPDGHGCKWEGGAFARIEAKNRSALRSHFAKLKATKEAEIEAAGEFTEPDWREVMSPDGVRCLVARFRDQNQDRDQDLVQREPLPDDLSIPSFLDRRPA
jgi:hypothetical protein